MQKKAAYEVGSGNVFADVGLPNAEEHIVKAQLVYRIDDLIKARGLKQVEAAKLLGVKQPDFRRCCGETSGNSRWSACCASSWRWAKTSISSLSLIVASARLRSCGSWTRRRSPPGNAQYGPELR